MQKRHFIVREVDGEFQLKEIDSSIANAMSLFGIPKGEYQGSEYHNIFYYFCPISAQRASDIAGKLSREMLGNND